MARMVLSWASTVGHRRSIVPLYRATLTEPGRGRPPGPASGRAGIMKKARLIVGVTAAIPVAAGGFAAPAAAQANATTASAHQVPSKGKTAVLHGLAALMSGVGFYNMSLPETLYFRGGSTLPNFDYDVYVTCYYKGNTGYNDPYCVHFTKST